MTLTFATPSWVAVCDAKAILDRYHALVYGGPLLERVKWAPPVLRSPSRVEAENRRVQRLCVARVHDSLPDTTPHPTPHQFSAVNTSGYRTRRDVAEPVAGDRNRGRSGIERLQTGLAAAVFVPPIPGMATVVLFPRRTLMSAPPCGSLPAVATELPLMFRQTALVSPTKMPLSEWMPCSELTASAKSDTVLFVTVAFSAALPSPASSTMPRSKYCRTWLLLINVVCDPPAPLAPTMMPNASDEPEPTTAGSPMTLFSMLPLKVPGAAALVDVDRSALPVAPERHRDRAIVRDVIGERPVERCTEEEDPLAETDRMVAFRRAGIVAVQRVAGDRGVDDSVVHHCDVDVIAAVAGEGIVRDRDRHVGGRVSLEEEAIVASGVACPPDGVSADGQVQCPDRIVDRDVPLVTALNRAVGD